MHGTLCHMRLNIKSLPAAAFVLLIAALLVLASFSAAHAQIPIGGAITVIPPTQYAYPCLTPPGLLIVLGPPTAGSFMYLYGASVVLPYGPPSHIGQWLLGLAGGYAPCITYPPCPPVGEPCPVTIGGGPIILFSGSYL